MKNIVVLGSTGSIGIKALEVISCFKDRFRVVGLSCDSNIALLTEQINKFKPLVAAVADEKKFNILKEKVVSKETRLFCGQEGIVRVATFDKSDIVVVAISGSAALIPLLEAIKLSKKIALANKESLVMAGELITSLARERNSQIIPIDSEHSAIFQCLNSSHSNSKTVKKLIITGSGGPLHAVSLSRFHRIKPEEALNHPKWKMGKKISIDSATLMNKGLEVIEAHWLFGVTAGQIEVLIHPEAIVHSMVEFVDGSVIAQLGLTDMRLPIQYALSYPERLPSYNGCLDLAKIRTLTFKKPDLKKFPCLSLAFEALLAGGTAPCVLNASNEELVNAYLNNRITLPDIPKHIEEILNSHRIKKSPSLDEILEADKFARKRVEELINKK